MCLGVCVCVCVCLCVCLCVCVCEYACMSACISMSVSMCLCVCLGVSVSRCVFLSVCLCFACVCVCVCDNEASSMNDRLFFFVLTFQESYSSKFDFLSVSLRCKFFMNNNLMLKKMTINLFLDLLFLLFSNCGQLLLWHLSLWPLASRLHIILIIKTNFKFFKIIN